MNVGGFETVGPKAGSVILHFVPVHGHLPGECFVGPELRVDMVALPVVR